jgi:hypothetical protein
MFERWKIDRRFAEIVGGIGLLLLAFAFDSGMSWLLAVAGIYLLSRQFTQTNRAMRGESSSTVPRFRGSGGRQREDETHLIDDAPEGSQIYTHARDAVLRAGLDPSTVPVLPVDLGLMVFTRDELPAVYRSRAVPDDVDFVQPFVQLRLATQATGKVRFEMIDADGQSVFIHEDMYNLHAGMNLVSPSARLPIHDAHAMHREWQMRISADGVLLAEHHFEWTESTEKVIRRHVQVDGELSNEMRQMLEDNRLEKMSLDELLGEQEEAPAQRARR